MLAVIVNCSEIVINVTSKRLFYLGGSLILGQGPINDEKGLSSHQVASNACTTNESYYIKMSQEKDYRLRILSKTIDSEGRPLTF